MLHTVKQKCHRVQFSSFGPGIGKHDIWQSKSVLKVYCWVKKNIRTTNVLMHFKLYSKSYAYVHVLSHFITLRLNLIEKVDVPIYVLVG